MTGRNWILMAVLAAALGFGWQSQGLAQGKYSTWNDPNQRQQSESKVQGLIDELKKLIRDARRSRAADPQFLDDLRGLVRRHENPWRVSMIRDDFSDDDFDRNPTWRVTEGRFWVERGFGLRAAFNRRRQDQRQQSNDDAAAQLFGALLNKALGGSGNTNSAQPPAETRRASIHVEGRISNAFAIQVDLTSWRKTGAFEIGPYQGQERRAGYRLFYKSGGTPSLELARTSRRGSGLIESYNQPLALEDNKTHTIMWTRDRAGEMIVSVDGKQLIKTNDRRFQDDFKEFVDLGVGQK